MNLLSDESKIKYGSRSTQGWISQHVIESKTKIILEGNGKIEKKKVIDKVKITSFENSEQRRLVCLSE